jgi:hypothetical protein
MLLVVLGFTLVSGQTLNGINARDLDSSERAVARYEGIIQFAGGSKPGTTPMVPSMDVQALQDAAYRGGEVYADHVWLRFNRDGSYDFGHDERCDEGRKYLSDYNGTIMTAPGKDIHIQGVPQSQLTIYSGRYIYMEDDFNYPQDSGSSPNSQARPGAMKMNKFKMAKRSVSQMVTQSPTEFKLTAGDAAAGDEFGRYVSIDGGRAVVGAHFDDDAGDRSGSAYVFNFNGTSWVQEAKLAAADAGDEFGFSVGVDGDRIIVGAYLDDDLGLSSGAAYIFKRNGTSWFQEAKLTASGGSAGDQFGRNVAISGNRAVVGAHFHDNGDVTNLGNSGAAYVFKFDGTSWTPEAKLTASDIAAGDNFGFRVSIDGERIAVGAYLNDDVPNNSGAAYIFKFDGTNWIEETKLTANDAAADDQFGRFVSIDGDRAVIGAHQDDDAGSNSGAAYIFKRNGTSWSQEAKLIASDADEGDDFGIGVAIDNDSVVVGARSDEGAGINSGAAYIFTFDGTSWSQQAKLTSSDLAAEDQFGRFVSIAGGRVMVGAYLDDDAGTSSGSAYIYMEVITNQPPVANAGPDQTVACTSPDGAEVTLDGSGSNDPDNDQLTYTWRENGNVVAGPTTNPTSQVVLGLGSHTIELTADDGNGGADIDGVIINVVDTTPPAITLQPPMVLWPADHEYVSINLDQVIAAVSDACAGSIPISNARIHSVSSDEPDDALLGDGITFNDIVIAGDCQSVQLRAERVWVLGLLGNGRVYTINLAVADPSGNVATASYKVSVPTSLDQAAVDDGPDHTVLGNCAAGSTPALTANNGDQEVVDIERKDTAKAYQPEGYALLQNYPNPFNPEKEIRFELPEASHIVVRIFTLSGQEIRTLVNGQYEAGYHTVRWNGRDNNGSPLASGVYLYQLAAGEFSQVKKMSLLR